MPLSVRLNVSSCSRSVFYSSKSSKVGASSSLSVKPSSGIRKATTAGPAKNRPFSPRNTTSFLMRVHNDFTPVASPLAGALSDLDFTIDVFGSNLSSQSPVVPTPVPCAS